MAENLESKAKIIIGNPIIFDPIKILREAGWENLCPYAEQCDTCHKSETTFEFICTGNYKGCREYMQKQDSLG